MHKLKTILLENPDTLRVKGADGKSYFYEYTGNNVVVTGALLDKVTGRPDNFVAAYKNVNGSKDGMAVRFTNGTIDLSEKLRNFAWQEGYHRNFKNGRNGHSHLRDMLWDFRTQEYKLAQAGDGPKDQSDLDRRNMTDNLRTDIAFRVFLVNDVYHFTLYQATDKIYDAHLPTFKTILTACEIDLSKVKYEILSKDPRVAYDERILHLNEKELAAHLGHPVESEKVDNEIEKRIKELTKKLTDMEADMHVKQATWAQGQKNRYELDMFNGKAELEALKAALKSGETEIKNVIITVLDKLEGSGRKIIPADLLYAELEKKLSKYGTSAVAIIQKLRDAGVNVRDALRELREKHGSTMTVQQLMEGLQLKLEESYRNDNKSLLKETPDTLFLKSESGATQYYYYSGKTVVVTGAVLDEIGGFKDNFIAGYKNVNGQSGIAAKFKTKDGDKSEVVRKYMEYMYLGPFEDGAHGHDDIEDCLYGLGGNIVTGERYDIELDVRFRVFLVKDIYYFSAWTSSVSFYRIWLPTFKEILTACKIDLSKVKYEVKVEDVTLSYSNQYNKLTEKELMTLMGDDPSESSVPPVKIDNEIEKRIKELSKQMAEVEADMHVKVATWNQGQKNRYKLNWINLTAELDALQLALKSGETDIKKVIITAIDKLEGSGKKIIPADILYAELEKKLSKYGTSAVAIIQNLKDRGIDIKSALRELRELNGPKITTEQLIEALTEKLKTLNEGEENLAMIKPEFATRIRDMVDTPEEFLKMFVGHTLKDLLDKVSISRLYVSNKFGDTYGEEPQQKIVELLDYAISYINFKLISIHRKRVDDVEARERKTPEYIKHHQTKSILLKKQFAASRAGDVNLAQKLRQEIYDLEDPSSYAKNMKIMATEIGKVHATPLSLEEVLPGAGDTGVDEKRYASFAEVFGKFKKE